MPYASIRRYGSILGLVYVTREINIIENTELKLCFGYALALLYIPKSHPDSILTVIVGWSVPRPLDRLPIQRDCSKEGKCC